MKSNTLEVWKTINLGTCPKTADDFRQAIARASGQVSGLANDIMDTPDFTQSIAKSPMELDLFVATTAEILGENGKGGTLSEIYAGIARIGGNLLPAEAGPQLRLQYTDQPHGERLLMAMEPIKSSGGDLYVFFVRRGDDDFWLGSFYDLHVDVWPSGYRWVFSRLRGQ